MIISYLGLEFFKIQFGDTILAVNPPSKDSSFKAARFGATVCLVSLNHPDMNGLTTVTYADKEPFLIRGPGEYEIGGMFVRGFPSSSRYGNEELLNTIYSVSLEGMNLCFLGALESKNLREETKEALDEVDVLFVPIGGGGVLTPVEAYDLSVEIEPKLVIPMHYGERGDKDALKNFLKASGEEKIAPIDKLTLKKKDLEGKEGEIVVLSPTY